MDLKAKLAAWAIIVAATIVFSTFLSMFNNLREINQRVTALEAQQAPVAAP